MRTPAALPLLPPCAALAGGRGPKNRIQRQIHEPITCCGKPSAPCQPTSQASPRRCPLVVALSSSASTWAHPRQWEPAPLLDALHRARHHETKQVAWQTSPSPARSPR
eukprot:484345-Pyramimonas_sp.AAC.1